MAGQFHRRKYFYIEFHKDVFGHIGKKFYGLVWDRWPLLTIFSDTTFYYNVGTFGITISPWIEIGLYIDFRTLDEIKADK